MGSKRSSGLVAIFIVALAAALGIMAAQGVGAYADLSVRDANPDSRAEEPAKQEESIAVDCKTVLERELASGEEAKDGSAAEPDLVPSSDNDVVNLGIQATYSYKVRPLLAPFNNIIFVETNNPDPKSFRFVDKTSRYLAGAGSSTNPGTFVALDMSFVDVRYENTSTHRVRGGYLFYDSSCLSDGGSLHLQLKSSGTFKDTGVQVSCAAMKDRYDYLIDTYVGDKTDLFDKMQAVQDGLGGIAIYPLPVMDSNKPNKETPYPYITTSIYHERAINRWYEMYERSKDGFLLSAVYPYVLDSQSFPSAMAVIAHRLEPEATISAGMYHHLVRVTYNGKSQDYGGAGNHAGSDVAPIYSKHVDWSYSFDGRIGDWSSNKTLKVMYDKLYNLSVKADQDIKAAQEMLSDQRIRETVGPGAWVRVAQEGVIGHHIWHAYAAAAGDGGIVWASDAWVDGRYVDDYEEVRYRAVFANHPKAKIIVRDMPYTDINGAKHQNDVVYNYDEDTDTWRADNYYTVSRNYNKYHGELPSEFILTRGQVEAMGVDKTPDTPPLTGYAFDGASAPGTPFKTVRVQSVSCTKEVTLGIGEKTLVWPTVKPDNADVKSTLRYTLDSNVAYVDRSGDLVGVSEGTTTLMVETYDGSHKATCKVRVVKDNSLAMYRLYNPNSGEHFYTSNAGERDHVKAAGWTYEGVGWKAPKSGTPVYRMYNRYGGEHHYTTSWEERHNLFMAGWKDEGVGWYSGGSKPLYRQYNPNAFANNHNYTTSTNERDTLLRLGWRDEGIAWYGW